MLDTENEKYILENYWDVFLYVFKERSGMALYNVYCGKPQNLQIGTVF